MALWDIGTGKELRCLAERGDPIRVLSFGADGKTLAGAAWHDWYREFGHEITVRFWDLETGRETRGFSLSTAGAHALAFSPRGGLLASGTAYERAVRFWDVRTGNTICSLSGHGDDVQALAFSPDGTLLASGGGCADRTIKLWEVGESRKAIIRDQRPSERIHAVAWSPDGVTLAMGGEEHISLFRPGDALPLRQLRGHSARVTCLFFEGDGRTLISGSWDGTVKLWGVSAGNQIRPFLDHPRPVRQSACSTRPKFLVTVSDQAATLREITGGRAIHSFPLNALEADPRDFPLWGESGKTRWAITERNKMLMSHGLSGRALARSILPHSVRVEWREETAKVSERASGKRREAVLEATKVRDAETGDWFPTLAGHPDAVSSIAFSEDGRTLASGGLEGTVKLWDTAGGKQALTWRSGSRCVSALAFSPDGSLLAAGDEDGGVILWEVAAKKERWRLSGHPGWICSLRYSPDGRRLASCSADPERTVRFWDLDRGEEVSRIPGHHRLIDGIALSPDGAILASRDRELIALWKVDTGEELHSISCRSMVQSLAFSPDGRNLASGFGDREVMLWDVASGKEVRRLAGHSGTISCLAFSPDGRTLASGGKDRVVKLWESGGKEMATLTGHTAGVSSVAFSPDGRRLLSGSQDGSARLWELQGPEGRELCALHSFQDGNWVVMDPHGHHDASNRGDIPHLHAVRGNAVDLHSRLRGELVRPGLLAKILGIGG